jgi:hypothetical protein
MANDGAPRDGPHLDYSPISADRLATMHQAATAGEPIPAADVLELVAAYIKVTTELYESQMGDDL